MTREWTTLAVSPTPGDNFGPAGDYVLRQRQGNAFNWSTHWRNSEDCCYYGGNYFDNIEDAKLDFAKRAGYRSYHDFMALTPQSLTQRNRANESIPD